MMKVDRETAVGFSHPKRFDAQAQTTELKALKSEAQMLAGSLPASEA
jgi:hypothetical protein